jgi:hypothetical protein
MNLSDEKIRASFVVEVLGKPPEHVTQTLKDLIKQIGEEEGVKVTGEDIKPPVLMKNQKDFYTTFAEIEAEAENIMRLVFIMFKYMPAHAEIISPQNFLLKNADFDDILNELTRRLHGYEELARILQTEKMILENKLREALGKGSSPEAKGKGKKKSGN